MCTIFDICDWVARSASCERGSGRISEIILQILESSLAHRLICDDVVYNGLQRMVVENDSAIGMHVLHQKMRTFDDEIVQKYWSVLATHHAALVDPPFDPTSPDLWYYRDWDGPHFNDLLVCL